MGARADKVPQHRRKGYTEVHVTLAVLGLQERLDLPSLGFLENVEGAEVLAECLPEKPRSL